MHATFPTRSRCSHRERSPHAFADSSGAVSARTTVDVSLSCDHRAVYGAEAARFLQRLRELLENPIELVVDI